MALPRRCLCWNLRTATFANIVALTVLAGGALLLRILDASTILDDTFIINQHFRAPWRSHQWQTFAASDALIILSHILMIIFALYMLYMITQKHFVLYMETLRTFAYLFILYIFFEFCFSVFEFSFYGLNTFRLAFVVFLWLYWLARTIGNICIAIILFARIHEIEDDMATEIRSSDKKYVHSYSVLG
ncbi:unnamed protein product [Candidula unifasciata]|uniref:Uncharacterized protein n=1 Tax=Candidula unifasciata TaxID=100452 RepID=A0A8S3ZIP9_9EUPU|nr:unnamed protein product [Candidula unifasciata]